MTLIPEEMKMTTRYQIVRKLALAASLVALVAAPMRAQATADTEKKIQTLMVEKLGDDAKTIRAAVVGDKAILTGQVQEKWTAELCKEVALTVPGIAKVDDQVTSKKAAGIFHGKMAAETEDAALESTVKSKLSDQVGKDYSGALEVEASDGVVSLRGNLPDATRREQAIKAAAGVAGVKKVIDLISVPKK